MPKVRRKGHPYPSVLARFKSQITTLTVDARDARDQGLGGSHHGLRAAKFCYKLFSQMAESESLHWLSEKRRGISEGDIEILFSWIGFRILSESRQGIRPSSAADLHSDQLSRCLETLVKLLKDPKYGGFALAKRRFGKHFPLQSSSTGELQFLVDVQVALRMLKVMRKTRSDMAKGTRSNAFKRMQAVGRTDWALMQEIYERCFEQFGEGVPQLVCDIYNAPCTQAALGLPGVVTQESIRKRIQRARSILGKST